MKYITNPVEVEAHTITAVLPLDEHGGRLIELSDGYQRYCNAGMLARMMPGVGDYYVVQADGYPYLNPKDVFERKYRPAIPVADPMPLPTFQRATCKGSFLLGSACGNCERCDQERAKLSGNPAQ